MTVLALLFITFITFASFYHCFFSVIATPARFLQLSSSAIEMHDDDFKARTRKLTKKLFSEFEVIICASVCIMVVVYGTMIYGQKVLLVME